MSSMKQLSGDTVRLITSSQVITSVYSVVKELLENALDANADNIDVKLDNFGFDKIEVRDNGDGITPENAQYMAQKHYTSKISHHEDLEALATYGFRGEALGSLCAVSSVAIVTKTKADAVSRMYTLDQHGKILNSKPSHMGNGTTVITTNLFKNIPVRRQYYSATKRRKEELKRVEDLVMSYGAIRHDIRVSVSHNKKPVWQKNKTSNQRSALLNTWGGSVMKQMVQVMKTDTATQVTIEAYLPKPDSDHQLTSRALADRCWISVNRRPVTLKEIEKTVKQYYCGTSKQDSSSIRHLVMYVAVTMPTHLVDVNLEPNKTTVLLQNTDAILSLLTDMLQDIYGPLHAKQSTEKSIIKSSAGEVCNNDSEASSHRQLDQSDIETRHGVLPLDNSDEFNVLSREKEQGTNLTENKTILGMEMYKRQSENQQTDTVATLTEEVRSEVTRSSTERVQEVQTRESVGKDFTCLKDSESIPQSQPQFDLMDSSLDLFDGNDTETKELDRAGNFEQVGSNQLPLLAAVSTNSMNITMEMRTKPDETNITTSLVDKESTAGIQDMTDANWSKGISLKDQQGRTIEPSVLLVPGKCQSNGSSTMTVNGSSSNPGNCTNMTGSDVNFGNFGSVSTNRNSEREVSTNQNSESGLPSNQNSERELSTNQSSEKGLKIIQNADRELSTSQNAEIELLTKIELQTNQKELSTNSSGDLPTNQNSDREHLTNHHQQGTDGVLTNQNGGPGGLANQNQSTNVLTNQKASPGRSRRPLEEMTGQTILYDLVGSTTIKRPREAFAFFSRQMRPTVVKDNPGLEFGAIASKVIQKWEELSDDERREYEKLGQKDAERYKEQIKTAKETNEKSKSGIFQMPARKRKKLEKLENQNLIDEMLASQSCRASSSKSPKTASVKEITVNYNIHSSKGSLAGHARDSLSDDSHWQLVGQISSNNLWLALKEQQLVVINQYRIEEALLYNRLMAAHKLPVQHLDEPVILNSRMLGGDENWVSLLSLQSSVTPPDPDRYFIDERLKANGFHIKQSTNMETSDVRIEVIAMTTSISYYGIDDLREILDLIIDGSSNLTQCRPLKISNYLKGEAMRMARGLSTDLSQDDIYDIIARMEKYLLPNQQTCLHGKPYLHVLHDMNLDESELSMDET